MEMFSMEIGSERIIPLCHYVPNGIFFIQVKCIFLNLLIIFWID